MGEIAAGMFSADWRANQEYGPPPRSKRPSLVRPLDLRTANPWSAPSRTWTWELGTMAAASVSSSGVRMCRGARAEEGGNGDAGQMLVPPLAPIAASDSGAG